MNRVSSDRRLDPQRTVMGAGDLGRDIQPESQPLLIRAGGSA